MSAMTTTKERRPSFGPTVYHEEDDINVRRPPRVYYEEVSREKPRRSSSLNSHPPNNQHEAGVHYQEHADAKNPIQSPTKPGFVETVTEARYDDDEKVYDEKYHYAEKPHHLDDASYVENPYSVRNSYNPRRGLAPISRYAAQQRPIKIADDSKLWWSQVRHSLREPFSEFFGTFLLVLFGDGSIAQVVLSKGTKGDYQNICWGWGIGVLVGVYAAGISGSNLNPAVTLASCIFRNKPWRKLPVYALAQTLGAFTAAGVVYGNYVSAINEYEGGLGVRTVPGYSETPTAGIFATYPQPFLNKTSEFFSEFIGSAVLMFVIFALQDKLNRGADKFLPLVLFFVLYGLGACFGWETGYAVNPARDFGPRLMTYLLGYGNEVWTSGGNYFWVPLIAPLFGCSFGGWIYDLFIHVGESPVNTPWIGLKQLCHPSKSQDSPV
ncbi:Aquaporin-3 [Golovinomyces cichoracearum]|uniref:Aquaporin-3 n=1 Tax=Golovinomyces cichoracearum TaxID=62708 RepID=A0A420I8Q7_9PEZI|nr:Aquaporin-3 [Golovinomyces cichoracearum]